MKLGIIGLGQAGSTITDLWSTKDNKNVFACINTSLNDSDKAINIKNKYLVVNGKYGGMAKERDNILKVLKEDQQNILNFIVKFISENNLENLILISSTAGGTGSGLVSQISRILNKKINIRCIIITPSFNDCKNSIENTLNTILELQQYNTSIRIISNNNYSKNENIIKMYNDINNYIIDTELKIISAGYENSLGENLDPAEVQKLMFEPGFSPIYRIIDDIEDINTKMIEKINNSLDLPISDDRAIKNMGFIIYSDIEKAKRINENEIENKVGIPQTRFRCILTPNNGEVKQILLIASGCSISNYINQYNEKLEFLNENIRERKAINFDLKKEKKEEFNFILEKEAEAEEIKVNDNDWLNNLSF